MSTGLGFWRTMYQSSWHIYRPMASPSQATNQADHGKRRFELHNRMEHTACTWPKSRSHSRSVRSGNVVVCRCETLGDVDANVEESWYQGGELSSKWSLEIWEPHARAGYVRYIPWHCDRYQLIDGPPGVVYLPWTRLAIDWAKYCLGMWLMLPRHFRTFPIKPSASMFVFGDFDFGFDFPTIFEELRLQSSNYEYANLWGRVYPLEATRHGRFFSMRIEWMQLLWSLAAVSIPFFLFSCPIQISRNVEGPLLTLPAADYLRKCWPVAFSVLNLSWHEILKTAMSSAEVFFGGGFQVFFARQSSASIALECS